MWRTLLKTLLFKHFRDFLRRLRLTIIPVNIHHRKTANKYDCRHKRKPAGRGAWRGRRQSVSSPSPSVPPPENIHSINFYNNFHPCLAVRISASAPYSPASSSIACNCASITGTLSCACNMRYILSLHTKLISAWFRKSKHLDST